MKLKLNEEEVEQILLEWAQTHFEPDRFNTVAFEGYSYDRQAILTWEEPEKVEVKEAA